MKTAHWKPPASTSAATASCRRCEARRNLSTSRPRESGGPITTELDCRRKQLPQRPNRRDTEYGSRLPLAWPGRRGFLPSNRQHVVVDLGDCVDAAQAHGHAQFIGDQIDCLGDAGTAESAETVNI